MRSIPFVVTISALGFAAMPLIGQALNTRKSPCDLITVDTASAILGERVLAGKDFGVMCAFTAEATGHDLTIGVLDAPGTGAVAAFQSAVDSDKDKKAEAVVGVGEIAAYLKSVPESAFHVLYHGKIISLGVRGSKNANLKPAMIQAVKNLLPGF